MSSKSGGIGLFGALTVIFIAGKLTGFINWSWLWVLSPLWIPWGIALVFLFIMLIAFALKQSRR